MAGSLRNTPVPYIHLLRLPNLLLIFHDLARLFSDFKFYRVTGFQRYEVGRELIVYSLRKGH